MWAGDCLTSAMNIADDRINHTSLFLVMYEQNFRPYKAVIELWYLNLESIRLENEWCTRYAVSAAIKFRY